MTFVGMNTLRCRNIRQFCSGEICCVESCVTFNNKSFIINSEVGGRTGCRLLVRDAAGDTESALLHEAVPSWVADVVIDRNIPRFIKIPFFLLPHPMMVKQDRMKKVNT